MPAHNPIQLDDRKRKPVRVGDRVRITIGRDKGRTGVYEDCVPRVGLWGALVRLDDGTEAMVWASSGWERIDGDD